MAKKTPTLKPHPSFPMPHPGKLLADDLAATEVSKTDLARSLGVSRRALYDVIEGKAAITAAMALRLEAVVGSSAEMWLALQAQHDLWRARQQGLDPAPSGLLMP